VKNVAKIGVVSVGVLMSVSCGGAGTADESTRDDGEVVEAGEVGAFRLQIGDCFDSDAEGEVESLPVVPCSDEHTGEVFHLFDLPDGEFPGTAAVSESAQDGCLAAFEGYVGRDFASSRYDIGTLSPTEATWDGIDDREIVCTLFDVDGARLTGSAAGSAE